MLVLLTGYLPNAELAVDALSIWLIFNFFFLTFVKNNISSVDA